MAHQALMHARLPYDFLAKATDCLKIVPDVGGVRACASRATARVALGSLDIARLLELWAPTAGSWDLGADEGG